MSKRVFEITIGRSPLPILRAGLSNIRLLFDVVLSRHISYAGVSLAVHAKGGGAPHFYNLITTANERDLMLGQMPALIAAFKREGLLSQALPTHTS